MLGDAGTLLVCAFSLAPQVDTAQVFLLCLWGPQISLQRNWGLHNLFVRRLSEKALKPSTSGLEKCFGLAFSHKY